MKDQGNFHLKSKLPRFFLYQKIQYIISCCIPPLHKIQFYMRLAGCHSKIHVIRFYWIIACIISKRHCLFIKAKISNLSWCFFKVTVNHFQIQFFSFYPWIMWKSSSFEEEDRLILCQSRNPMTGFAICYDKISWIWVTALKGTNECLHTVTQQKASWDLMTGMKLTHGIMVYSKHHSSQISCHLAQWGFWEELGHIINYFNGIFHGF